MKSSIFTIIIGVALLSQWAQTSNITTSLRNGTRQSEYRRQYTDDYNSPIILENLVIRTISGTVHAHSSFNITFKLPPSHQKIRLELQPNHDIISPDAYIQHLDEQGRARWAGAIDRSIHRAFKGAVFTEDGRGHSKNLGRARIYVMRDGVKPLFRGAFTINGEQCHAQLQSTYMQMKRGFVQSASGQLDSQKDDYVIAYKTTKDGDDYAEFKRSHEQNICPVTSPATHADRDALTFWSDELGSKLLPRQLSTAGCPASRRIALIGITADCSYTASFTSAEAAHWNIISVVNSASEVFERSFNVSLQVQNITIANPKCPETAPDNAPWNMQCGGWKIQQRLDIFSQWRGSMRDNLAYWTLMTNCANGETGLSQLGQLCNSQPNRSQPATGAAVVVRTLQEWQVFA